MALDPRRSYPACNSEITGLESLINSGKLRIYTGTAPTNCDDAPTGSTVATLTMNADCFGTPSNGAATANAISPDTNAAGGTAGYWRVWDSGITTAYLQGTCGVGASYDMNMNSTTVSAGANVSVSSFTYTAPRN
jgi:hypothetical protein